MARGIFRKHRYFIPIYRKLIRLPADALLASITVDALTSSDMVAGGKNIVITLVGDTWISDITSVRQDILNGMNSAQSEVNGWNNEIRDKEVIGSVIRTNESTITITLSAAAGYYITANEVITVAVPASALTGGIAIVGSPTIGVADDTGPIIVFGGFGV